MAEGRVPRLTPLESAVKESRLVSNTITRLLDCGDRVTATVLQQWYRTQMVGDVLRNIETAAVQDEEWVKTADGWKRGIIGNVHPGAWVVDGNVSTPPKGTIPTLRLTSHTPTHLETAPDDQILGVWLPSRLIPHRHRPRAELQPAHELQVDMLR